jgi:hypothetical protein
MIIAKLMYGIAISCEEAQKDISKYVNFVKYIQSHKEKCPKTC